MTPRIQRERRLCMPFPTTVESPDVSSTSDASGESYDEDSDEESKKNRSQVVTRDNLVMKCIDVEKKCKVLLKNLIATKE